MRTLRLIICVLGCLSIPAFGRADIFRYVDDEGRIHFVQSIDQVPEQFRDQVGNAAELPRISRGGYAIYTPRAAPPLRAKAAHGRPQIDIYVTNGCPYCARLEQYLTERQLTYRRIDIQSDSEGAKAFQALGGRGVPLIKIGSTIINGFNPGDIEEALRRRWQ